MPLSLVHCVRGTIGPWWRHEMETFSALLAICAENSPVPGEFPAQRPVTRSFDVFFDLRLNKRLSKQSWGWWFETISCSLWRHRNVTGGFQGAVMQRAFPVYDVIISMVCVCSLTFCFQSVGHLSLSTNIKRFQNLPYILPYRPNSYPQTSTTFQPLLKLRFSDQSTCCWG